MKANSETASAQQTEYVPFDANQLLVNTEAYRDESFLHIQQLISQKNQCQVCYRRQSGRDTAQLLI